MAVPPFNIDQTKPGDTDIVSQFPANERTNRDVAESWLLVDHDTNGKHAKVTLPETAKPASASNTGFVYTKDFTGKTELCYEDDSGNEVQLTANGQPKGAIPSGTIMLFLQAAAPTGWTQVNTWNDRVLRVVDNTGVGAHTAGSWTISGLSVDSHILTVAEMPAHTHTLKAFGDVANDTVNGPAFLGGLQYQSATLPSNSTGGDGGHTHGLTAGSAWRPSYVDAIACSKD